MTRFRLAVGLHNHQPVGNFEHVMEEAHQRAYRPFLELLARYPRLSISLHQSGILWDWQERNHPEYLEVVRQMVKGRQLELMTGGFYEPILTSIPELDLHGQIEMLTRYVESRFGDHPEGLWLTERVWEPHLPKVLAKSGIKYLPVDDTHFLFAGLDRSQLTGPFVTEHEGCTVTVLPIQKKLRYLIPFGRVEEVIEHLQRLAEHNPGGVAVYADDGEKFGVWPKTYEHCYVDGWLDDFFTAVERNADWLEIVPLAVAAAMHPVGRVYIPSASYEEMGHWALPTPAFMQYENFEQWLKHHGAEQYERFARAGHWRGFLAKYDEANLMHKKMLWVSRKLDEFARQSPKLARAVEPLRDRLYASQCNCPYWHGVFGGLYLPHLRQAVYGAMIEASAGLRHLSGGAGTSLAVADYDADNTHEIIAENSAHTAVFKPDRGGMLIELSLNRHNFNVTDTLMRRKEGYHQKLSKARQEGESSGTASIHDVVLTKEPGLQNLLVEDWYLKRCFIDHFLTDDASVEQFHSAQATELGDFVLGHYRYELDHNQGQIVLFRDGGVWHEEQHRRVRVVKIFVLNEPAERIDVIYELTTTDGKELPVRFAVENNFSFQAGHADDRYVLIDGSRPVDSYLDSIGEHAQSRGVALADEWRGLAVALWTRQQSEIWHHPIHTVSLSEAGFEKVYQGTTVVNLYRLVLSEKPVILNMSLYAGAMESVLRKENQAAAVGTA